MRRINLAFEEQWIRVEGLKNHILKSHPILPKIYLGRLENTSETVLTLSLCPDTGRFDPHMCEVCFFYAFFLYLFSLLKIVQNSN